MLQSAVQMQMVTIQREQQIGSVDGTYTDSVKL